jgi:hypothetical protein
MPTSYSGGLNFSWPVKKDTNWDGTVDAALTAISGHDHTGGGKGAQINTSGLAADSVTGAKLRLDNAQYLRARNAAGSADVNLLRLDAGDLLDLARVLRVSSTETLAASGAISLTTSLTILNGASLAMTLANGQEGQLKFIVNIAATNATVTPATTSGANTVTLFQHGFIALVFLSGEWRVLRAVQSVVTDDTTTYTTASPSNLTATTYRYILNTAGGTITLQPGVEGQEVVFVNINASSTTVVGSVTAGVNSAALAQHGSVRFIYMSGEWRAFAGAGCTLT